MTEKRFTIDDEGDIIEFDWNTNEYIDDFMWGDGKSWDRVCNRLNELYEESEQLKQGISKLQSKYDKSKTDEVNILVETENTVLLGKKEFEEYVRKHNELRRRNKRRKEKNRKYRNELKKRLREISGLKEFIAEDLSSEDKVLKGFIEEYL